MLGGTMFQHRRSDKHYTCTHPLTVFTEAKTKHGENTKMIVLKTQHKNEKRVLFKSIVRIGKASTTVRLQFPSGTIALDPLFSLSGPGAAV